MAQSSGNHHRAGASAGFELPELTRREANDDSNPSATHYDFTSDGAARTGFSTMDSEAGFVRVDGDISGPGYNETQVDVIAVPCPGASPIETWARDPLKDGYFTAPPNDSDSYPTEKQLLRSTILSPVINNNLPRSNNLWIQQGVRTKINTARVLLYQHRELVGGLTIDQLADDLLEHLYRLRRGLQGARPIFFICHSIGGLVVKRALVKAREDEKLQSIMFDCHGITFFATPHRGSSYLSMTNLRDSIQHLLYLSRPLPRSLNDELRLNHRSLIRLHEQFMDFVSEMHIWTFYETEDSQLSGLGASDFDEVHFSAPLASIKSSLVGGRREQAFSLESEHAKCASFGPKNTRIMDSYLEDLSRAVGKAHQLSTAYVHTPLNLSEHVKLELIGFYDDPDPETVSDVRLYVSKHHLDEFLEKGPERCLSERLSTMAVKSRRGSAWAAFHERPVSSGSLSHLGTGALGIWSNLQDFGQRLLSGGNPRSESIPRSPEQAEGPEIVVKRPSISDIRATASEPTMVPRRGRGLTVPSLATPRFQLRGSRSSSASGSKKGRSNETAQTLSDRTGSEISQGVADAAASLPRIHDAQIADSVLAKQDSNQASRGGQGSVSGASALQDLTAGFSRPDPTKRKFMWIHLPYTNPHWVKSIFDKLADTQHRNYSRLLRNEYWIDRHVHGRHGQAHASYVRPGCGFVPAESRKLLFNADKNLTDPSDSPRPSSPTASGRSSPALTNPNHLYLYLPYLHFDTYLNLIRRRKLVRRRMAHGRARPVPQDVAKLSLDMRVIWEFIGHDPPLNTRRTLDQYGYPSLRDTYARDDDQMMYKLTKEHVSKPLNEIIDMFSPRTKDKQPPISPVSNPASKADSVGPGFLMHSDHESSSELEDDILDGNILMVDQLWLWAVDTTTLTTFFPKRESHPTEGPMFQQADLRNSVYNELNGDLTGRCDNALDLAGFIVLHAVSVLLDRSSHPDLEIFRIFEEAIGILTERMTSSLKRFRMQTFRDRIHDSDSDDIEYDDNRSESIRQRHKRELEQAESENRENTSALLELRDMDDELKTLLTLFREQNSVIQKMRDLYNQDDLRDYTQNGRLFLEEALSRIANYEKQVGDMMKRIDATRTDYEKLLEMVQRKAQVDEVRWSRLQTELASTQNLSVIIFTAFTVIFLPLSFFTSLFGMNTSDWAGEEGNAYVTLKTIGSISLPSSGAIIALALIAAFSSRVQGAVASTFKVARGGWDGAKDRMSQLQSDKHQELKLKRSKLRQDRARLNRRKRERGYDFWETVRLERRNKYQIPELNRKRAAESVLGGRVMRKRGHWRDRLA